MGLLNANRSVVLIIDMQGKLMDVIHRPPMVISATKRLMKLADLFGVPVLLTEQYSKGLGGTLPEIREVFDGLSVRTRYLDKTSFGCCGDPEFRSLMRALSPIEGLSSRQVVVAGIEAHVCVLQTVLELLRAGDEVHVCWDCVSGRGDEYRRHALERMVQAGAEITNHESVGFEWARDKDHPRFKELSALLKEGQP